MIRRGQDSNLQSSGHEPDESTNSSTPLLPLIFLSLFPPGSVPLACLVGIEPAFRLRLGAEVGAPSLTDDWYELAESTSVEAKEEARGLSFQAKEQGMSALLLKRIRFLAPFYTQIPD